MDTLETYRQLIQDIITTYTQVPYSHGDIKFETVFAREQDRYLLMILGREDNRRVHGCLIHVDIINGKFWIERDGTEKGVANELVQAGIPKDKIVLGFRSAQLREHSEFAVI